jgi:hypothetical protein
MVIGDDEQCIPGASIEVVGGQRAGQNIVQQTPCDTWADSGGVIFWDVVAGDEMILRATASGYTAQEMSVVPMHGPQRAVIFTPSRIR